MGKINEKLITLNKKINEEKSNDNYFNNKEKNSNLKEFETFDYLIKDEIYLVDLQNQSIISRHKTDLIKM